MNGIGAETIYSYGIDGKRLAQFGYPDQRH